MGDMSKGKHQEEKGAEGGTGLLQVIYGDVTLGVRGTYRGAEFHYIFSYAAHGMESLAIDGREWLYRSPRPTFWRAATDNDRGSGFPLKSGMWLAADMFIKCTGIAVAVNGEDIPLPCAPENNRYVAGVPGAVRVKITYTYETVTNPATKVCVAYEMTGDGEIRTDVHYYGLKGLPQLPAFGIRFVMPTCADRFRYEGLSGETYPDRKAGGIQGIYEVQGLPVTPYLVPQDCGVHMDTKWVEIYRSNGLDNSRGGKEMSVLHFDLGNLAFSCLPYTASELENATHQEELPPPRRTVFCIYGAVRGVGGIDSWGTDVEEEYWINAEDDIEFRFSMKIKDKE